MNPERDFTAIDLENGSSDNDHANGKFGADGKNRHEKENGSDSLLFKCLNVPITLKFEDVVYKIKMARSGKSMFTLKKGGKTVEKIILKGITGVVRPGEMLAMLGPSGSGKTTLLTALGGRLGGDRLEGRVTYNGRPFSNSLKRTTGFVTQDDIMYSHLTVAETLIYTALLRLPKTLAKPEKVAHAEAVLGQLGLAHCRNSLIGDRFTRGVSGGERKRVSIGQEMLVNPSLLFLDEPTSGLDSTTAQRIVRELWGLAKGGRTVVMTIHQPSSRLFYMFHKVLLLAEGNPLYFGEGSSAMAYFESVGYTPSITMNPADFLLDLANNVVADEEGRGTNDVRQVLVSAYKDNQEQRLKEELRITEDDYGHKEGNKHKDFGRWPTTWWQQFDVLLRRGVKERKHESFSGMKVTQVLAVALLCGLLWWHTDNNHLQDKIGLLFFYSVFWGFFPLFNAIFTFPQERSMLEKERSSGMYRLSSYFMARIVGDLPMELVLPTIFLTITYWMAAMQADPVSFFRTLFALLYNVLVAQGLGLAIGAIMMKQKSATTLASVIMLSFMLAGGFYVQRVPKFIAWIQYVSISHYAYKLQLGSQFHEHSIYPCSNPGGSCLVGEYPAVREVGLSGQAVAAVALGVMLVGYRMIAYLALMRIGVVKR